MLRHIVLLRFNDETSEAQIQDIAAQLRELPAAIPEIKSYLVGVDARLAEANAHISVIAEFDDEAGYRTYSDDPTHQKVIKEAILANLDSRTASQYEF